MFTGPADSPIELDPQNVPLFAVSFVSVVVQEDSTTKGTVDTAQVSYSRLVNPSKWPIVQRMCQRCREVVPW